MFNYLLKKQIKKLKNKIPTFKKIQIEKLINKFNKIYPSNVRKRKHTENRFP